MPVLLVIWTVSLESPNTCDRVTWGGRMTILIYILISKTIRSSWNRKRVNEKLQSVVQQTSGSAQVEVSKYTENEVGRKIDELPASLHILMKGLLHGKRWLFLRILIEILILCSKILQIDLKPHWTWKMGSFWFHSYETPRFWKL